MKKISGMILVCLVCFCAVVPAALGETLYYGTITDPAGDHYVPPTSNSSFDLLSGSASVTEDSLILTATFDPNRFNWQLARIAVSMDIDQDLTTGQGWPYTTPVLGVDYALSWGGSTAFANFNFSKYDDNTDTWSHLATGFVRSYNASTATASISIPLTLFGNTAVDEFNFIFGSQELVNDLGSTGVLDSMPGDGLFGATTAAVPEPGTMLLFGIGLLGIAGLNKRKA